VDQRTYELIAQFITDKSKVHVELLRDIVPHAVIEEKTIRVPLNIEDDNVFAALAVTITRTELTDFANDIPEKFEILNAFEDIRIDLKNFRKLPNIKDFYQNLYVMIGNSDESVKNFRAQPLPCRVLSTLILRGVGFGHMMTIQDKESRKLIRDHQLECKMSDCVQAIEDWARKHKDQTLITDVQQKVDEIFNILYPNPLTRPKPQPKPGNKGGQGQGQGQGQSQGQQGQGKKGQGNPLQGGGKGQGVGDVNGCAQSNGSKALQNNRIDKIIKRDPSDVFKIAKHPSRKTASKWTGQVALEEQTKNRFAQLLNEKCVKKIPDGSSLDTDNLVSFFTGDIDTLFKDDKVITRKHSKIILILDASGSMSSSLLDGKDCKETVRKTAKSLELILKDICEQEGANVEYEVAAFCSQFHQLSKANWEKEYMDISGGTSILKAFNGGAKILNAPDVDGEKLMVFITDGCVSEGEISDMKRRIIAEGSNMRAVILGCGADINGHFVRHVIGSNNIMAEKHANLILMEAIMELLTA